MKYKLGLGTVQFGTNYGISNSSGQTPADEVTAILNTAYKYGIGLLDTASAYGDAESVLGLNDCSRFQIVSKFMPPQQEESITSQLLRTLENLRVKSLYGYLAHRPNVLVNQIEQWEELNGLKDKKMVQRIGFSLSTPEELEELLSNGLDPDIIQVPFNYFDRRFGNLALSLKKSGCEIHLRSAFLQGLFFIDTASADSYFDPVKPIIRNLQNNVRNLPGALLNYVIEQPFADRVIIGVDNRRQLVENLKSLSSEEKLPDLEAEISDDIIIPHKWPKTG
ncbi:MAG: aldo/keto reductase [Balneolaceae bacterium]|nr:aldo/keto reductase [Balneolaceae bacterium]